MSSRDQEIVPTIQGPRGALDLPFSGFENAAMLILPVPLSLL